MWDVRNWITATVKWDSICTELPWTAQRFRQMMSKAEMIVGKAHIIFYVPRSIALPTMYGNIKWIV